MNLGGIVHATGEEFAPGKPTELIPLDNGYRIFGVRVKIPGRKPTTGRIWDRIKFHPLLLTVFLL